MAESKKQKKKKTTFSARNEQTTISMPSMSELEYNSKVYAAALQNPWDAEEGVRIPDKGSAQSATIVGRKVDSAGVITGATSGYATGVTVYPYSGSNSAYAKAHSLSAFTTLSAGAVWSASTWDTAEPNLAANAKTQRVVAMGVEFWASGTEQDMNTRYFCGYTNVGNIVASDIQVTDYMNMPNAIEYSYKQMQEGVRMIWLPAQYDVTHDTSDISIPAAAYHGHALPTTEYDPMEWVPFCVGVADDAAGGGIYFKTITHYEYIPDYEDSQSVSTATVYGDMDSLETAKQAIIAQGKPGVLRRNAGKIVKAARNFIESPVGAAMAAKLIKASPLGGPIATLNKLAPKPLKQIAGRLPIVGGLLGNLFSSRARRLIVTLGVHTYVRNNKQRERLVARFAELLEEHEKDPTQLLSSLHEEVLMITKAGSVTVMGRE